MISIRHLQRIILVVLFYVVAACNGTDSKSEPSDIHNEFESQAKKSAARIYHEEDWTIVFLTEDDDHVYWFLAPEVDNATPALFKKTVYATEKDGQKMMLVSECEAPRHICDDLMKKFRTLSKSYN